MSKETAMPLHDRYGRTLLWWAAAGGDIATVEALVAQYNFNPRAPNKFGQTPFWIASKKGHAAVSDFLNKEYEETDTIGIEQQVSLERDNDQSSIICYVCTSNIGMTMFHYHCRHCAGGNWYMCEDCKGRGAFCEDSTHPLLKRATRDGGLIEVAS